MSTSHTTHTQTYIDTHKHSLTHIHIHTHTHTLTHTYTHRHKYLHTHRQQSEEAAALKASTQGKGREPTAAIMEKIIAGKVSKRLADICLLNQVSALV